jgi:serine/threonine protein kinase
LAKLVDPEQPAAARPGDGDGGTSQISWPRRHGTPAYMSPNRPGACRRHSDIFSFGAVLRMVTARAFSGMSIRALSAVRASNRRHRPNGPARELSG